MLTYTLSLPRLLLALTGLALVLMACNGTPAVEKIDFKLNDVPAADADSALPLLTVQAGDTIRLWDVTTPKGSVVSRNWKINGQPQPAYADLDYIDNFLFADPGLAEIELCVNGEDLCLTRLVRIVGEEPIPPDEPQLTIISPTPDKRRDVTTSTVDVRVSTLNVFNDVDLKVTADGEEVKGVKFSKKDDGTGELTAKVRLNAGAEKEIVVSAETADGDAREQFSVSRIAISGSGSGEKKRGDPSIVIERKFPGVTPNTRENVSFTTRNIYKSELRITSNGQPIAANKFTLSRGRGRIENLTLEAGTNKIVISGRGTSDSYIITQGVEAPVVEKKPLPPLPPPPVPEEKWSHHATTSVHRNDLAGCSDFSTTSETVILSPRQEVLLRSFQVKTSGCGKLLLTLKWGQNKVSEVREVPGNLTTVYLAKIDKVELMPGISYTLSVTPQTSADCSGPAPTLLNAAACGKSSNGDGRLGLRFGGGLGVFGVGYDY